MRVFIIVLVLIFSLQSLTKADDISDFEIEGMSIGDSLLDYYSEKVIKDNSRPLEIYEPFGWTTFSTKTSELKSKLKQYAHVQIEYILNDKNYTIQAISGKISLPNFSLDKCIKDGLKISSEIREVVGNDVIFQHDENVKTSADKSGKSIGDNKFYIFKDDSFISVRCVDWSDEVNFRDRLSVNIVSIEFRRIMKKAHPHHKKN